MNTKKLTIIALFIALSAVGGFIKLPSAVGSIALDIFPALIAVIIVGNKSGALVGGLGHMISAQLGGLPLGPLHLMIAVEMALLVLLFGLLYQSGRRILASILFVLGNGLLAALPFAFIISFSFYIAIAPMLLLAAFINTILALLIISKLKPFFKQ